jgi:hypothetical protein
VSSPPADSRFRRPRGYRHGRRTAAGLLFLIGFVLAGVSLATAWWSLTESGGGTTVSVSFYPGSDYVQSCGYSGGGPSNPCGSNSTETHPYTATRLNHTAQLYGTVQDLLAGGVVFALSASIVGLLGAYGLSFGRGQLLLTLLLGVIALVLVLAAPAWAALGGPGALGQDIQTGSSSPPPYATTFWGTNSSGSVSSTWGPGAGWFAAVAGSALLLVGLGLLLTSRRDPYSTAELRELRTPARADAATPPAAPQLTYYEAPPVGGAVVATHAVCPACGSTNSAAAWVCWKCQRPLR